MTTATATASKASTPQAPKARPGRPKGSTNRPAAAKATAPKPTPPAQAQEPTPVPPKETHVLQHAHAPNGMGITGVIDESRAVQGYMTPKTMDGMLFISHFESEDPDSPAPDKHGYQREPIKERIPGIARFYLDGEALITPLTLSVRLKKQDDINEFMALFNKGDKDGILKRFGKNVISIVDGQHRFLGLVKAHETRPDFNPRVPVMLYFGLSFVDEARLFDTINSTQRKLPKALIESTKVDVTEIGEVSYAQRIREIAAKLARSPESPWFGLVNMTGARNPDKPITFEGLRRSTGAMFSKELLGRIDAAEYEADIIATDYWKLVKESCEKAWNNEPKVEMEDGEEKLVDVSYRLKELVGVAAVSRLGQSIVNSALEHENFDHRLAMLTTRLSEVDWEKSKENPWMANQQAGFAGQPELFSMLYAWVYSGIRPGK